MDYESAWREMTERMAYWVDLDNPYVTLDNDYVESCWWALKQMFDKGLLQRTQGSTLLPPNWNLLLKSRSCSWIQGS